MNAPNHKINPQEEKRIAKEMSPFLIYAAIPVLLIVFIALAFGPSY